MKLFSKSVSLLMVIFLTLAAMMLSGCDLLGNIIPQETTPPAGTSSTEAPNATEAPETKAPETKTPEAETPNATEAPEAETPNATEAPVNTNAHAPDDPGAPDAPETGAPEDPVATEKPDAPETGAPDAPVATEKPDAPETEWNDPEWTKPEWNEPATPETEGTDPEWTKPEWNDPEWTKPEWDEPATPETEGTDPEWTKPEWNEPETEAPEDPVTTEKPDAPETEWNEPEWTKPEWNEPETEWNDPEWTKPEWDEPATPETEWTDPEWTKPEWTDPEWTKPEWTESDVPETEWTDPEWTKPEWTKPEWTKPEWTKPEWTESDVPETEPDYPEIIPPDINLGGMELNVLSVEELQATEWCFDGGNGDVIDTATYNRLIMAQKKLNAVLNITLVPRDSLSKMLQSDPEYYNAVTARSFDIGRLTLEGYFRELTAIPALDLKNSWWPENLTDDLALDGRLYSVTGDISPSLLLTLDTLFYNKDLVEALGFDDIESMVFDESWTLDRLYEVGSMIYEDSNCNGESDSGDIFGLLFDNALSISALPFGIGVKVLEQNADYGFAFSESYTGEHMIEFADYFCYLFFNTPGFALPNSSSAPAFDLAFNDNSAAFVIAPLAFAGEIDVNFGILPCPKLDEDQLSYVSVADRGAAFWAIPKASDAYIGAVLLEALGSCGEDAITPAIRKQLFADNANMFDVIENSLSFEPAILYNTYISRAFRNFSELTKGDPSIWIRTIRTNEGIMDSLSRQLAETLRALPESDYEDVPPESDKPGEETPAIPTESESDVPEPEWTEPETEWTDPEWTKPEWTKPEWTESDVPEPETEWTEPETEWTDPEWTKPEWTKPEWTKPEWTKPEWTESDVPETEWTDPEWTKPEWTEPETEWTEPEWTKPEWTEPETEAPEIDPDRPTEPTWESYTTDGDAKNWVYEIDKSDAAFKVDGILEKAYYDGVYLVSEINMPASGSKFDVFMIADETHIYVFYEFTKTEPIFWDPNYGSKYHLDCVDFCLNLAGTQAVGSEFRIYAGVEGGMDAKGYVDGGATKAGVDDLYVRHTTKGYNVEFSIPLELVRGADENGYRKISFTAMSTITIEWADPAAAPARVYTVACKAAGALAKDDPSYLVVKDAHIAPEAPETEWTETETEAPETEWTEPEPEAPETEAETPEGYDRKEFDDISVAVPSDWIDKSVELNMPEGTVAYGPTDSPRITVVLSTEPYSDAYKNMSFGEFEKMMSKIYEQRNGFVTVFEYASMINANGVEIIKASYLSCVYDGEDKHVIYSDTLIVAVGELNYLVSVSQKVENVDLVNAIFSSISVNSGYMTLY